VRAIVSAVSSLAHLPVRFLKKAAAAPSPTRTFRPSAPTTMPSLAIAETVAPTETILAISGSTLAAERFKAILETPLNFEIAKSPVSNGLNGRYTPLNKPFQMAHGTGGGLSNGAARASTASSRVGEGMGQSENGDGASVHINGATGVKEDVISTEWTKIFPRPPGLKNFMNTCYMNSTLQALMHIPPLVAYLLKETHSRQCKFSVEFMADKRPEITSILCILSSRTTCPRILPSNPSATAVSRPPQYSRQRRRYPSQTLRHLTPSSMQ